MFPAGDLICEMFLAGHLAMIKTPNFQVLADTGADVM